MKAWLPTLVDTLEQTPILALSTFRNLARAAVFSRAGELLAGALGSPELNAQAADEARLMAPGEIRFLTKPAPLTLEALTQNDETRRFWATALENQDGAWASWLLTMPQIEPGGLKLTRHLLSAFGPWTSPRLPEEFKDQWSLLPLKAGLGRLFVLGDDDLALELAALAARTGLSVTWLTTAEPPGPELAEARLLADFERAALPGGWLELTPGRLAELGVKNGVRVVVATAENENFLPRLTELKLAYLALSGEAESQSASIPGLFKKPLTTTQKALGLVAEMLR
jgi:hypothetical protein